MIQCGVDLRRHARLPMVVDPIKDPDLWAAAKVPNVSSVVQFGSGAALCMVAAAFLGL